MVAFVVVVVVAFVAFFSLFFPIYSEKEKKITKICLIYLRYPAVKRRVKDGRSIYLMHGPSDKISVLPSHGFACSWFYCVCKS